MRGNQFATAVALACFIVLSFSQMTLADNGEFTVTSYIPEKFTDFSFYVSGDINLTGNNTDQQTFYTNANAYERFTEGSSSEQTFRFQSMAVYEYVTRPITFTSSTSAYSNFLFQTSNSSQSLIYSDDSTPHYQYTDRYSRSVSYSLRQSISARLYPQNAFFIAVGANINHVGSLAPRSSIHTNDIDYQDQALNYDIISDDNGSKAASKNYYYNIDASITQGIGRVEYGVYGATALYIIDELDSKGLLDNRPGYDDMVRLADLLYQFENHRPIDKRIHRMESIQGMLNFLTEIGTISNSGPAQFVTFTDVLDYFPNKSRKFGYLIGAGVGISYGYEKSDRSTEQWGNRYYYYYNDSDPSVLDSVLVIENSKNHYNNVQIETDQHPYLTFAAEYFRPIDLRWQLDLSGQARYYLNAKSDTEYYTYDYEPAYSSSEGWAKTNYDDWYSITLDGELTYIMNSRTSGMLYGNYLYNQSKRATVDIGDNSYNNDLRQWNYTIGSELEYRISIPTTLTAQVEYYMSDGNTYDYTNRGSENDRSSWNVSVGIAHYLY